MKKKIFLDYAATTPLRVEVADVIINEYKNINFGQDKLESIRLAKNKIAQLIGCLSENLYITSCGSESNNAIIKAVANNLPEKKRHIITSSIEHPSVLNVFKQLEREGFEVTYLKVDDQGLVLMDELYRCVGEQTGLVSIMFYNNEVGTRQPIEAIGKFLKEKSIFFHVDGVQAVNKEIFKVDQLPVDAMSFSAHKLYGPKGIGGLYLNPLYKEVADHLKSVFPYCELSDLLIFNDNIPFLMGFACACDLAAQDMDSHIIHLEKLKFHLINQLKALGNNIKINAEHVVSHPGIVNILLPQMDGDSAMINLDMMGFAISTGSACSSGAVSASHVLLAMGLTEKEAKRCLRISLGYYTTFEDVDGLMDKLQSLF